MADLPPWTGGGGLVPSDGSVTDAKVAAGAGIQKSKLGPLGIVDADVAAGAAIAKAKLGPLAIVDGDINAGAAIAKAKLAALAIVDADVAAGAAIAKAKLAALAIVDADVAAGAAIAGAKINLSAGVHLADVFANRPAAAAGLNGLRFFATDKTMEFQCVAGAWVLTAVLAPEVTVNLPAAPIDRQECVFVADAANGVKWHLRFDATSGKWHSIGGPPVWAEVLTDEIITSAVYVDATTVGPQITLPAFAGDWEITIGASMNSATVNEIPIASVKLGAAATSDNDLIIATSSTANAQVSPSRTFVRQGLAASAVLKMQYRSGSGNASHFARRNLQVRPVRVG